MAVIVHNNRLAHPKVQPSANRQPTLVLVAALILPLLLIYGPSAGFPFLAFGDGAAVFQNTFTQWWPHPGATLSHWIDVKMLGPDPRVQHAVNVVLHCINALLVFFVLNRLTSRWASAAIVAGLWALHPARAEAVSWIAQRGVLLAGLFILLMFWFWGQRVWRYLFLVLALLSYPVQPATPSISGLAGPLRALMSLPPWDLSIVYPPAPVWMAAASVALTVAVAWLLWRDRPPKDALIGWLWFAGCAFAAIAAGDSDTLRWTYLGHLGLFYALVFALGPRLPNGKLAARAAIALCLIWTGFSWARSSDFRDTFALAEATRKVTPNNEGLLFILAQTYFDSGSYPAAEATYRRLTEISPATATYWVGLGNALVGQKNRPGALACFEQAVKRDPKAANAHYGIGIMQTEMGNLPAGIEGFRKALELGLEGRPAAIAANNLGSFLARDKKTQEALGWFEKAIAFDPKFPQAHIGYGLALNELGRREEAIFHLQHKALLWTGGDQAVGDLYTGLVNQTGMEEYEKFKKEQAAEEAKKKGQAKN